MREVLAFAFEASLLVGQAQETAVSKKLASWLAILAVPTAVAGIYGMNFKYIPELQLEYGYFIVLGSPASDCTGASAASGGCDPRTYPATKLLILRA
jgi:magnesium transporter